MKLLDIIQPGDSGVGKNKLYLADNKLVWEDENGQTKVITENNFGDRPLHCREAKRIIDKHSTPWFIKKSTTINGKEGLYVEGLSKTAVLIASDTKKSLTQDENDELNNTYKKLFNKMTGTEEIYFCNSALNVVDLNNNAKVVELSGNDLYSDTVDLNTLISFSSVPDVSCKVDLNIQYSINGEIYSKTTSFTGFSYKNNKLENYNFIEDLGDVELSFVSGILKVTPKSIKVDEFIINSCTVTYGKLS